MRQFGRHDLESRGDPRSRYFVARWLLRVYREIRVWGTSRNFVGSWRSAGEAFSSVGIKEFLQRRLGLCSIGAERKRIEDAGAQTGWACARHCYAAIIVDYELEDVALSRTRRIIGISLVIGEIGLEIFPSKLLPKRLILLSIERYFEVCGIEFGMFIEAIVAISLWIIYSI